MRRYVASLCMLLFIHLVLYGKTDMCSEMKSENLDCFSNYADRISCIWNKGSYPGNGSFLLTVIDYFYMEASGDCNLLSSTDDGNFHCNITGLVITETDLYIIRVEDLSTRKHLSAIEDFQPLCNIKLDPPSDLSHNFTGTVYNITWGNCKFNGESRIHYELQLKKEASSLMVTKKITHDTYVEMMLSEFDKGDNYIKIRCRTENQWDYKSYWSEWSSELKIQISEMEKGQKENITDLIIIVTIVTVIFVFLLCFNLSSRINVTFVKKIPTAADFFHPLYHIHNGNFQDWVKYPNKSKKDKSGRAQHSFPQDLYRSTVSYFHKEAVSPVELESPFSKEGFSLTPDTRCDSMPCSDLLTEKEASLDGMYPTFFGSFPGFSDDIVNEKDIVCTLDCPTDYFSYDGNYVANSQEIVE
ncbi:interleukin-9 receptor-like isoform X2 [Hyla sarda]|nr:interleukin-9 receptor-like isoform X2 [Hyla sarda]XP_056390750.1 interleukin-9 receptor-like isoform X2 [Hyla sarda]